MLDAYLSPTPNGWKISILLEEAEIAYNMKPVNIAQGDQFTPEFLQMSPSNRMPAIKDANGVTVFESGAIMLYLCDTYPSAGKFCPPHLKKEVIEWLFWMNANLGPMAGQVSHFVNYAPQIDPQGNHTYALNRYKTELDLCVGILERRLKDHRYVAGDTYTVADMACWSWMGAYKKFMGKTFQEAGYVAVHRWHQELKQRPGLRRGVEVLKAGFPKDGFKLDKESMKNLFGQKPKL